MPAHFARGGRLVLLGGGDFSFGDTEEIDRRWLGLTDGPVAFVPAASGSADYGRLFVEYLEDTFERSAEVVPIYRARDARRGRNLERLGEAGAIYLGGGVADHLLDALEDSPALEALAARLRDGVVVAMAAAAKACGVAVRRLGSREMRPGLGWVQAVVETNFDPERPRRFQQEVEASGRPGLALTSESAAAFGPEAGDVEAWEPEVFTLAAAGEELELLEPEPRELDG